MNDYLISIRPQWMAQILNGEITALVLRHAPKPPFTMYAYCKKAKRRYTIGCMIFNSDELYRIPNGEIKYGSSVELMAYDNYDKSNFLSGKVPCKFVVEKVEKLEWDDEPDYFGEVDGSPLFDIQDVCKQAGISDDDLIESSGDCCETLSFLHITSLEVFDKPKKLGDFHKTSSKVVKGNPNGKGLERSAKRVYTHEPITKAPSSWCYVIPPEGK